MEKQPEKENLSPGRHALRSAGKVILAIVVLTIFAYAVEVTQINLEEPQDPQRQAVTTRVIRALANPDFLEYHEEIRGMNINVIMPCPEEVQGSQTSKGDRVVVLTPNCADTTQEVLTIKGEGFRPRTDGIVRWYPPGAVATTRALTTFRVDRDGNFEETFSFPDIRETAEPQRIEVEEKWSTGIAGLSETSKITIEKIIETIFLALMATIVGTILAVPISFLAARNLMENVSSPLASIMAAVIAIPIGYLLGFNITLWLVDLARFASEQLFVGLVLAAAVILAAYLILRLGPPVFTDEPQSLSRRIVSIVRVIIASMLGFLAIALLANVGIVFGEWLTDQIGVFSTFGNFIFLLSEAVRVLSAGIVGLLLAMAAASFGSKYGQEAVLHLGRGPARLLTGVLAGLGMALFLFSIASALNWLYQYEPTDFQIVSRIVVILGGLIMFVVGVMIDPKRPFRIGFWLYTLTRSILNIIRSIEPLIYVIVFAVWVGIGPFAGVLALTIHTVAALGKLFSEQVENISEGPIEAITATGASRLQMIVFAVIPQIVPPYIAFTLYRWDINVRFSTIIGFAGGGGIGFVLVQNINLLKYRQAAVMMIAIATVVMTLDYISSKIRTRII